MWQELRHRKLFLAIPLFAALCLGGAGLALAGEQLGVKVNFIKNVDNSAGGSATADQFEMILTSTTGGEIYDDNYAGDTIGVVPDTYLLTESPLMPDYISSGGCYNSGTQESTDTQVTIKEGDAAWTCGFTNTYVPPQAKVTFSKAVYGGPADPGDFEMTLTSTDGGATYAGNHDGDTIGVVAGTYVLTESSVPGYVAVDGGCGAGDRVVNAGIMKDGIEVTIDPGDDLVCGFANEYILATVTFLKNVDNSAGGSAQASDFEMTLTGDQTYSGYSGDQVEVLAGTYTLTESSLPGYTSIYGGGCYNKDTDVNSGPTVTIAAGENWVCGFTNTYVPAEATPTPTVRPTEVAPTATPTVAPTAKPTAKPSPSTMPDTATGGNGPGGDAMPLVLIGFVLLLGAAGYSVTRFLRARLLP